MDPDTNQGGFVVAQHGHHLAQMAVVGLVSVPPLASIAAAHCGQHLLLLLLEPRQLAQLGNIPGEGLVLLVI